MTTSFPELQQRQDWDFPHDLSQMVHSPSVESPKGRHTWVSAFHLCPTLGLLCSFLLCSMWASITKGIPVEVTDSVLSLPPLILSFPFCLCVTTHPMDSYETRRTPCLPLVLFLEIVEGHPAFEVLHSIQDLAVLPAIGVFFPELP